MDLILVAVISLGAIGLIAAVILYAASKKFAVYEDPRIAKVSEVLPQANCGGCGYPGCSGFAGACVKAADAGSLEGKLCPVGGAPVMEKVAAILGLEAVAAEPKVAVVRCNGSCENRPRTALYDGAKSCAIAHATSGGETGCTFGCLGCGDCVEACQFDEYITLLTKKKQDVEPYQIRMDLANKASRMLDKVENVQIIDSLVVDKDDLLSAYTLSEESGTLTTYQDFFQTNDPGNSSVYMNQKGDKIYYAHSTDGNHNCRFTHS